jgi:protoporphyrinogen oxidase
MPNKQQIIVAGAGPAGLTATYDLSRRGIPATCYEADHIVGGISRTVSDSTCSSRGLEYFCSEGDALWERDDEDLIHLATTELHRLGLVTAKAVFDGFVVRMPKCYPVYDEGYNHHLMVLKSYLTQFENLHLCGRYGLFKYNNMDHSILTAFMAIENALGARHDVWSVNADDAYHEEESA